MNYEKAYRINGLITGTCFMLIALLNIFMKNEFVRLIISLILALILTVSEGVFIKRTGKKVTKSDKFLFYSFIFLAITYIIELFKGDF